MEEIPNHIYQEIISKLDQGDVLFESSDFKQAITLYDLALEKIPEPKEEWQISVNVFVALGDAYHKTNDFGIADYYYNKALQSESALENTYVWYVLGRNYFVMGYSEKSKECFISAYMLGGKEIFKVDDYKYLECIENIVSL
ncbi:hypothetical protein ACUN24_20655 [Pedobacter sp. WC2501]|uniref:hypothetical protein n=1 Tax=Pedobacter sp. WC2501 TaxID=3461400 RepID=UPI004045E43A